MSRTTSTQKLSPETVQAEVQMAVGDLETVSAILIAMGHADIEVHRGWLQFFGRSIEFISENLKDVTGRLA